jgi:hypothetical protein
MAEQALRNCGAQRRSAEHADELPDDRDPTMLAATPLSGVHAMSSIAPTTTPRPPPEVTEQVWLFVAGAVGISEGKDTYR